MSTSATAAEELPVFAEDRRGTDDVAVGDENDGLDAHQRRALDAAITESLEQAANGLVTPAAHVLACLRARRG